MKNIKNKDLKGPLNNNFLSHLQKLKQQSVRSKAGDKTLFQTSASNKLGGYFNNNQFDDNKKVIYKAYKPELEEEYIFTKEEQACVMTAYLDSILSNTEMAMVNRCGKYETFIDDSYELEQMKKYNDPELKGLTKIYTERQRVRRCIKAASHAFSWGILNYFSNRIKNINDNLYKFKDGKGSYQQGINRSFTDFYQNYKILSDDNKKIVKKALRHQMYLMQFLNFCDRQDGNVIVKNVSPLQMKNIDLEYIPNDDHVEEKKIYIDLMPIYQLQFKRKYTNDEINAMIFSEKAKTNNKGDNKNEKLYQNAYNELYTEILGLNTEDYFNANEIKKIIAFNEENVRKAIKQALSIKIDMQYDDFEKEILKILMAKIDFQKQLIKEIEDPYDDKKKVSSVPIQVCSENNNKFAERATRVKNIIIEDNNKTEQLIKQIKNGNFKYFFISQQKLAKQQIEQHDLMDLYSEGIKKDDGVANLTNISCNKQSKFM